MAMPDALRQAAAALAVGERLSDTRERHARLSAGYRQGAPSAGLVTNSSDVTAYVTARMPATYAAIAVAFAELQANAADLCPGSVLDAGCGPGTGLFAALDAFPTIERATGVDHNSGFLAAAQRLADAAGYATRAELAFLPGDLRSADLGERADLVLASYALVELDTTATERLVAKLWAASSDALVLIEPGSRPGFARLRQARAQLIAAGATILAPCTHALACPIVDPDWCHFSVRLPRSRAHLAVKSASVPYEDEKFAYLVARRSQTALPGARVIAPPHHAKSGITLRLCTGGRIEMKTIRARDADHKAAKKFRWGDAVD